MGDTRYARNGAIHIAYETRGDGDLDVLFHPGANLPMDALDDHPSTARIVRRLQIHGRLVLLDRRGVGQSDPVSLDDSMAPEANAEDILAVLDAIGSTRCVLVTFFDMCLAAMVLGAEHHERVAALALIHGFRQVKGPDELEEAFARTLDGGEDGLDVVAFVAPSSVDDPRFRAWFDSAGRRGASPAVAARTWGAMLEADATGLAAKIRVPTVVIQRAGNPMVTKDEGRALADIIPGAVYAEVPGHDHLVYSGDVEPVLDAIDAFLGADGAAVPVDRVLATILFTDIVGSTGRAAELGDRRWRELLDAHDDIIARVLGRFDGRLVKATGDGLMASFDSPGRAIGCAAELRDVLKGVGIEIRAGIHTGEMERRGDDFGGIGVHIASRIMSEAGSGDVYVSGAVPALLAGSEFTFEDQGIRELKGVPGSWQVFRALV